MNLFDLFGLKKAFTNVFTKENFTLLVELAKEKIIEQVKEKDPGQEKMDKVVAAVIDFIEKHMTSKNGIVNWVVENLVIANIRTVLQALYEALKQKVKDL